jgi:hypothetical protein
VRPAFFADRVGSQIVKDPVEVVYSTGHLVYVNRHVPIPPAPPPDASEDEKLAFDRANFWVGLVSEFRAEDHENVYVRLFWLYWPEELPMGRQPYHGKRELVMSNHVDIVEAQTIACHAEISHWDENDDSNKTVLSERYWRQTYDLNKMATAPQHALSKLRKFCICGGYDNPELDMYQCHTTGCGMWNHERCLVAKLEERAWEQFQRGLLTHEVPEVEEQKTLSRKIADTVGHIVEVGLGMSEVKDESESSLLAIKKPGTPKALSGRPMPWTGKLEGQITKADPSSSEGTHRATIEQLVSTPSSKTSTSFKPKMWNMEMKCLRCDRPLN